MEDSRRISLIKITIIIICFLIPFINSILIFSSFVNENNTPNFFGYKPFIITTESMKNILPVGSIVVVKKVDNDLLKKGDIITYKMEDGSVITHRIIEIKNNDGKTYYVTKGDENYKEDDILVTYDMIEGKYIFKILYLGSFALFIRKPIGLISLCLMIFLAILIYIYINNKKSHKVINDYDIDI